MELTALFGTDYTSFVAAAKRRLKESVSDSDDSQFSEPINTNSQQDVYYLDDEAREIAQQVYERPELRMLFSASKNVSAEDLTAVIALVNRMKKEDD